MPDSTRSYNSPLRKQEAANTRRKILDAAVELFGRDGFALTSMQSIADLAGVSVQSVNLAGPKAKLLIDAFEREVSAVQPEASVAQLSKPDRLRNAIRLAVLAHERTAALFYAIAAAAHADPGVRDAYRELFDRHTAPLRDLVVWLGVPEQDVDAVYAKVTFLLSASAYLHFVEQQGWNMDRYTGWLEEELFRAVGLPH